MPKLQCPCGAEIKEEELPSKFVEKHEPHLMKAVELKKLLINHLSNA